MATHASDFVPSRAGSAWKSHGVQDRPLGGEVWQLLRRRPQEQAAGEQAVPGLLGHDAQRQAVARVGAGVAVEDEQVAVLEVGADLIAEAVERRRAHRLVAVQSI